MALSPLSFLRFLLIACLISYSAAAVTELVPRFGGSVLYIDNVNKKGTMQVKIINTFGNGTTSLTRQ
jgi:hypothetical protein